MIGSNRANSRRPGRADSLPQRRRSARRVVGALVGAAVLASSAGVALASAGSAQAATDTHSPRGHVDVIKTVPGAITLTGWTLDPDQLSTVLTVYVWIDATLRGIRANRPRPDVATAYPGAGAAHGFTTSVLAAEGRHSVCVVAANVGTGFDTHLACATVTLVDSPVGRVDTLTVAPGGVRVAAWTFDPDAPAAVLTVHLQIDGTARDFRADRPRPDVAAVYPLAGTAHGLDIAVIHLPEGPHRICVVAGNLYYGRDKSLACKTLTVADTPRGAIGVFAQAPGGVRITGWAFDPDLPRTALTIHLVIDGRVRDIRADRPRPEVAAAYPTAGAAHGFDTTTIHLTEARHGICVVAANVSYGIDKSLGCKTMTLQYKPSTAMTVTPTRTGVRVAGWSSDPDTTAPILVRVTSDGRQVTHLTASGRGATHSGHNFVTAVSLKSGTHLICAIGVNVLFGTGEPPPACRSVTLRLSPFGHFETVSRAPGSAKLLIQGWSLDPDTSLPIKIAVKVDAAAPVLVTAAGSRVDVGQAFPQYGPAHGFSVTVAASVGEHTVCIWARNISGGIDTSLGCRVINAVHPVAPSAPRSVHVVVSYGSAVVSWTVPARDGGAPVSGYTVTASPGGAHTSVSGQRSSAGVTGLAAKTRYTFSVVATNVAGRSVPGISPAVTTPAGPPPQTSPAPISTSRYIRNISDSPSIDLAKMRAEGAADAGANPAGHRYLILLDIGGQDEVRHGVLLSATTRFVSYANLVRDIDAYVDGYASRQVAGAPATIALGTNNDMDVSASSGASWARNVVTPVATHALPHPDLHVAGANDIEPGFRGTYAQSRAWVTGYLGATSSAFVFNGSADGCASTVAGAGCNNGWTMAGLYALSAGAMPTRIVNLPQVYNNTMAAQWKYISLTGVAKSQPRINFGGALTEFTACAQAGGCGSLTGTDAWLQLWRQLQSQAALRTASLPYSTDLRIDG